MSTPAHPVGHALVAQEPHHTRGWVKRFDPLYWTVNFARPAMACVTATAPDALRVTTAFQTHGDLVGLIWEAQDKWSHPLLAYATARDFSGLTLSFEWRSDGVRPLDAVHGPTLTIEGCDANGQPASWYVRLWNYAQGTPTNARITLDFDALDGGFMLPSEAVRVDPRAIDRMFISLVAPEYNGTTALLADPAEGWVEMRGITCTGAGSTLAVGDVCIPPHSVGIANGYDDSYHLTPQRVVKAITALGYRGDVVHYVGMSHFPRLHAADGRFVAGGPDSPLNAPAMAWHAAFAAAAREAGIGIIWSLSYELLAQLCPDAWQQRAHDGTPARTGWEPPSALLSPASADAMAWLQSVAAAFIRIGADAGLPLKFQVGEPWWWVMPDTTLCLYDDAADAVLGSRAVGPVRTDATLWPAAAALLEAAGQLLADSTAALVAAARAEAGETPVESLLLVFAPTVLDDARPHCARANVPLGWAAPAFDRLQLEDYDWVTGEQGDRSGDAAAQLAQRLGYPIAEQDYFAGFVLNPADRDQWHAIMDATEAARRRGHARRFVWALPQALRDGLVLTAHEPETTEEAAAMQAFDDVLFPISIGREAQVTTEFATQIISAPSGHEQRVTEWHDPRLRFDAGPGVRSEEDIRTLTAFFRARRGPARGFRFADPFDDSSAPDGGVPHSSDQIIGTSDAVQRSFALTKCYGETEGDRADAQVRRITHPRAGSVIVAVDGAPVGDWTLDTGGSVRFAVPPPAGAVITAGFRFDVPVRFAADALDIQRASFLAGDIPSVPLIEVRL